MDEIAEIFRSFRDCALDSHDGEFVLSISTPGADDKGCPNFHTFNTKADGLDAAGKDFMAQIKKAGLIYDVQ